MRVYPIRTNPDSRRLQMSVKANRSVMFIIACFTCAGLIAITTNSCTKEKSPVVPFNPYLSDTVSYSTTVAPLVMQNCSTTGCHDAATAENGYNFTTYASISGSAENMLSAMRGLDGFTPMPYGTDPLPDSSQLQFEAWIVQGKLNN